MWCARVVERYRIDYVFVAFERQELLPCQGVPYFAGPVVGPCNKSIARLVEATVGQRQDMSTQDLEEVKVLRDI